MPLRETTYRELHARQINILKFQQDYLALYEASPSLQKDMRKYEQFNDIVLQHLFAKEKELYSKYVMKDMEGNYMFYDQGELMVAGRAKPRGYTNAHNHDPRFATNEDMEAFSKEWDELMEKPCKITL